MVTAPASRSSLTPTRGRLYRINVLVLVLLCGLASPARAACSFFHDFPGPGVDPTIWAYPTGDASFYGRTQIRPGYPPILNGSVCLPLDTHNPSARTPGDSFFGSEIFTRVRLSRGMGCRVEVRGRLVPPIVNGLVGGIFLYRYFEETRRHSEIDFELLSNLHSNSADKFKQPDQIQTNLYVDEPFGAGRFAFVAIPGLDVTQFNTYRFDWLPDRVRWYINDQFVRTESRSPKEDLFLHLNFWAPACDWAIACDPNLIPASRPEDNRTYYFCVDWVRASEIEPADVQFRSAWKRVLTH